ncbi:DUF296 domain-containing protein [Candidatus Kaiserbacteria bacterium]|nr:DUF296 domain-containing protein [Candidatus Kaiserbacteria bacterium]
MKSVQIHNGFFIVFDKGEEVISTLTRFGEQEGVHWGAFEAIGAVEDVQIGYYDRDAKQYFFRKEKGVFEVASLKGNLAEVDNEGVLVHAHAVLSRCDDTLETIGGHVKSARVAVTLEMILWLVSQPLTRVYDDDIGLNLIQL